MRKPQEGRVDYGFEMPNPIAFSAFAVGVGPKPEHSTARVVTEITVSKSMKALVSMVCLTVVFTVNTLAHGPNGLFAAGIVAAIAGLGGWAVGRRNNR